MRLQTSLQETATATATNSTPWELVAGREADDDEDACATKWTAASGIRRMWHLQP